MREILIRCGEAIIYAVVFDFIEHGFFRMAAVIAVLLFSNELNMKI